jgi:FkbM family methyltransferase
MNFDTESPWGTWKAKNLAAISLAIIDALPTSAPMRILAFIFRRPIKRGRQELYDRMVWGFKLRLSARGNLTEQRWLTMPNFHDRLERLALAKVLTANSVFLDVGANAGFYTFWALSLKYSGLRVLSIEPTPILLNRLRYNLKQNELEDSVSLFPCAVTAENCELTIDQHPENIGKNVASNYEGSGLKVMGRPLLDILNEAGVSKVDAMKIDIEGYEVPVLTAFFETAPTYLWPRFIIGEVVEKRGEPFKELLLSKGYHIQYCTKMKGIMVLQKA